MGLSRRDLFIITTILEIIEIILISDNFKKKPGRNDPCWCGSGKKYKKCHFNRENEPPVAIHEIQRHANTSTKICLHPNAPKDCQGPISKAHSVSKNAALAPISRRGHVYSFDPNVIFTDQEKIYNPTLIGINKASIFTGFCNFHDHSTFRPLENRLFTGTQEQCFLLGYRALCMEYLRKVSAVKFGANLRSLDRGQNEYRQRVIQNLASSMEFSTEFGRRALSKELDHYKNCLTFSDYSPISYYVCTLSNKPEIVCSFAVQAELDFAGRRLLDLGDPAVEENFLTLAILPMDSGGAIVFSWGNDQTNTVNKLVQSFDSLPDCDKPNAILRFVLTFSENIFFNPDWWESLSTQIKRHLCKRFWENFDYIPDGSLLNDGINPLKWNIIDICKTL